MALVCVISLLIGAFVGVLGGKKLFALVSPTTTPAPTPTPTPTNQISILLIGVDSLASRTPNLESCWVLTFVPDTNQFFLAGFSPMTSVQLKPGEPAQYLKDIYATDLGLNDGDSSLTRSAVHIYSSGSPTPKAEVVFDREMLAVAIDLLGGVQISGTTLNGSTLLDYYDFIAPDEAQARLEFQQFALEAIVRSAQKVNWSKPALRAFMALGQRWNPDQAWFLRLAEAELPLADAEFLFTVAPLTLDDDAGP